MSAASKVAEVLAPMLYDAERDGGPLWADVGWPTRRAWLGIAEMHARRLADANLLADEPRVMPDVETVARAIRVAGDTTNNSSRLITESTRQAEAVLGLLADAPTRAEVRKQVAEEIAVEVESNVDWSNGRNGYGDNEGYEHAARIAREIGNRE